MAALFILGLALLLAGAEGLVRSASRMAKMFGVSPLLIGLTVVAFGTSTPELFVSCYGAYSGKAGISLGNIIGSNIFNILFILGFSALITPLTVRKQLVFLDVPVMVAASVVLWLFSYAGTLTWGEGVFFLTGMGIYTHWLLQIRQKEKHAAPKIPYSKEQAYTQSFIAVASLALLLLGATLFVKGAEEIARFFGISDLIIGLTVVAIGTSLPELATSIVAAYRKEQDIAIGNILGSNIFNVLFITGLSLFFAPEGVSVPANALTYDLPIMILVSAICFPILYTKYKITRIEGLFLLLSYGGYLYFTFSYPPAA